MTPSELFKPYTGMTVEGSTEKERAEIYDLLEEKGIAPANKGTAIAYGFYYDYLDDIFISAPFGGIRENIPYTEFKQLIEQL